MNKLLFLEGEEVIGPTFFCLFLNFHSVPGVIGTSTVYLYYVHKYENGEPVGMWKKRTNKKKNMSADGMIILCIALRKNESNLGLK